MSEPKNQFAGTLLLLLTVACVIAAVLSIKHLRDYRLKDDGVTWVDRSAPNGTNHVVAAYVTAGGPGDKARIRLGDELVRIEDFPIHYSLEVPQALFQIPQFADQARYTLRRNGIEFQKDHIFLQAATRESAMYYEYVVGFAYLLIGLFVYYRRTSAAKSLPLLPALSSVLHRFMFPLLRQAEHL